MGESIAYEVLDFLILLVLAILAGAFTVKFVKYLREVDPDGKDKITIATVICIILALFFKVVPKLIAMIYAES